MFYSFTRKNTRLRSDQIGKSQERKSPKYMEFPAPLSFLHVTPLAAEGVPVQITREMHKATYWDYPLTEIKERDADMRLIDYFNINTFGSRDFEYCRVRIFASSAYPDIAGRDALLEFKDVKIFFDDTLPNAENGS
jgi:hypothetical protein